MRGKGSFSGRRMRFLAWLLLVCVVMLAGCEDLKKMFSSDLRIDVLVEDARGLYADDKVYLEASGDYPMAIGRIAAIEPPKGGHTPLKVVIEAAHKQRVKSGALFLVDRPLIASNPPRLFVAVLPEQENSPPMESGAVVVAKSMTEYQLTKAGQSVRGMVQKMLVASEAWLLDLEKKLASGDADPLLEQLEQKAAEIEKYSRRQKERFEKEVLPELDKLVTEAQRFLKERLDEVNQKELKEKYDRVREALAS